MAKRREKFTSAARTPGGRLYVVSPCCCSNSTSSHPRIRNTSSACSSRRSPFARASHGVERRAVSGRIVSAVFESGLPAWIKPYAAVYASFAADDGTRVYPSVARIAQMVGRSTRRVKAATSVLRLGVLVIVQPRARYRSNRYRFVLAALPPATKISRRTTDDVDLWTSAPADVTDLQQFRAGRPRKVG